MTILRPLVLVVAPVALGLGLAGCNKDSATTSAGTASSTSVKATAPSAEAREAFKTRCVTCHGEAGKGDGPGSVALNPKPRNYTDKAWQKSITDEQIKKTIVYGGAAVGKSPLMPSAPDLDGKPVLDGLVAIVREFGK